MPRPPTTGARHDDAYTHIEECWGFDANPFPGEAVSSSADEPHSAEVFPHEELEFRTKVVRGALQGGRKMTHLWSIGPFGGDTGFGKTALMRATAREINSDWGAAVQAQIGLKPERAKRIAAGFAEVNQQGRNGLYPVTFAAVQNMATGPLAIFPQAHEEIVSSRVGDDTAAIIHELSETRLAIAPSGPPLRPDLLDAFAAGPDDFAYMLSEVSEASQVRSGIQYFAFAFFALAAAGTEKCFIMIDQLEDLGKKGALSAAKRRREIGRIRDLLKIEPYAGCSISPSRSTRPQRTSSNPTGTRIACLASTPQAPTLPPWWSSGDSRGRPGRGPTQGLDGAPPPAGGDDDITPFTPDALTALRTHSEGRPGYTLRHANEVFMAAAEKQLGSIDGAFVNAHLGGAPAGRMGVIEARRRAPGSIAEDLLG